MAPQHILVTGGAGFIGSHVVDELVASGHQVRVLDCLHELAHGREPDYLNPAAEYRWADVRDQAATADALDGIDAVSHQAAMVGLGVDLADMPAYVSHNCLGTAVLLKSMAERGFRGRIVLAGSMVVYGEGRYFCPEHGLVTPLPRTGERLGRGEFEPPCPLCQRSLAAEEVPESAPPDPRNVYAASKLHQEHLCQIYARETGAGAIALRYHNVYGPRMPRDTPYAGVASIFASALAAGRAPRVFEDGEQTRDFVHVRDVARVNVLALTAPEAVPEAFNVCSGRPRTVGDMARALHAAHGEGAPEPVVTGEYRLGDVRHVFASADRARAVLGFSAEEDFAEGMVEFARAPLRAATR